MNWIYRHDHTPSLPAPRWCLPMLRGGIAFGAQRHPQPIDSAQAHHAPIFKRGAALDTTQQVQASGGNLSTPAQAPPTAAAPSPARFSAPASARYNPPDAEPFAAPFIAPPPAPSPASFAAPALPPSPESALADATVVRPVAALFGEPPSDAAYQSALQLIEQLCPTPKLSPRGIAQRLGCSRATLYRLFAAHGETVAGVVWSARLHKAWRLLTDGQHPLMPLSEIAQLCGFTDQSTFSRMFKRRYGISPRQAKMLGD